MSFGFDYAFKNNVKRISVLWAVNIGICKASLDPLCRDLFAEVRINLFAEVCQDLFAEVRINLFAEVRIEA